MMAGLFSSTIAKALAALSLVLALTCAGLLIRSNHWHARSVEWEKVAGKWKTAQQAQEVAYIAAQADAKTKATAARLATEEKSRQLAERADDDATIADLRAAAARYGDAHRMPVRTEASPNTSGGSGATRQADIAARGDGPGDDAVVLSRVAFDQLAGNTLRLDQVQRWGQSLIDAGLAIAAPTQNGKAAP